MIDVTAPKNHVGRLSTVYRVLKVSGKDILSQFEYIISRRENKPSNAGQIDFLALVSHQTARIYSSRNARATSAGITGVAIA